MNRNRAILLAVIQVVLVLSVAGKYLYERKTCPRVWVRTAQFDPNMPMRGRYLALQLSVDACSLPRDESHHIGIGQIIGSQAHEPGYWQWQVVPAARDGKLVAVPAGERPHPETTQELTQWGNRACERAVLSSPVDYYIPDTARTPLPLKAGQELWVEVTVPPMGPPRPIQLAMSENGTFTPLKLD